MKLVTAIIKPHKLDDVRHALTALLVQGLTATEVKGFGRQKGHREIYRGAEYTVEFMPKVRLDIVVREEQLEEVIKSIRETAHSGSIGDGKIFISSIEEVIRIRTGETGPDAL
jgi:nitrogen regulatory protein P-II 2